MTFDVERLWEECCPRVYGRLGLHCVEKYVTDDLYDEQAWARFSGGNIVVRLVMERTDLLAFLAPRSHEPKWYIQEIAGWLGEGWVNIPAGRGEQFQQLGAFLERRWTELQELFAPERVEASLARLEESAKLQEAERRRRYMGE